MIINEAKGENGKLKPKKKKKKIETMAVRVRILARTCEPEEYSYFCPTYDLDRPEMLVRIGGHVFSSLTHFLIFSQFEGHDLVYAQLFTAHSASTLTAEFEKQYTSKFGRVLVSELSHVLNFMRQEETYFAWKRCVLCPTSADWFATCERQLAARLPELTATWIAHRFAGVHLATDTVFESSEYAGYARLLTEFVGELARLRPNPAAEIPRHHHHHHHHISLPQGPVVGRNRTQDEEPKSQGKLSLMVQLLGKASADVALFDAVIVQKNLRVAKEVLLPHRHDDVFCRLLEHLTKKNFRDTSSVGRLHAR